MKAKLSFPPVGGLGVWGAAYNVLSSGQRLGAWSAIRGVASNQVGEVQPVAGAWLETRGVASGGGGVASDGGVAAMPGEGPALWAWQGVAQNWGVGLGGKKPARGSRGE